jgi:hypothetical protein
MIPIGSMIISIPKVNAHAYLLGRSGSMGHHVYS